jgi:hypothetical protein
VLLLRNWLTLKIAKARDRDLSLPQPQCIDDADRALELVKKHHLDAVHRERAENRAGQARYFAGLVSGNQKWLEDATELLLNADKSRKDEIHRWEYRYYAWQCYLRLAVKFPGDPKRQLWIAEARKYAELVKDDEEADMEQRTQAANWLQ